MPLSAKEVALELETDARTLRKFLRDTVPAEEQPGQGGRWAFEKKQLKGLKKRFAEWVAAKPARTPKASEIEDADDIEDEIDEDFDEIDIDD